MSEGKQVTAAGERGSESRGAESRRAGARFGSWTFAGNPEAVRRARASVAGLIDDPDAAWTAGLLVTELATNAVDHAGTAFKVTAVVTPARVRVGVEDGSRGVPVVRGIDDPGRSRGRGMLIVEELAGSWGYRIERAGKTVWFELFPSGRREGTGGGGAGGHRAAKMARTSEIGLRTAS